MKKIFSVIFLAALTFVSVGLFVSCEYLTSDTSSNDGCGDNKYTLYSYATNSYNFYSESYCKSEASDRGYKCYSYDSANNVCYGYK